MSDKANQNYSIAALLEKSDLAADERYLNHVGNYLQQAAELGIKHILLENGVAYPGSHDITQLIQIGKANNVNLNLSGYIDEHSEMFTLWESKKRYIQNYQLESDKVNKALEGAGKYLRDIEDLERREL